MNYPMRDGWIAQHRDQGHHPYPAPTRENPERWECKCDPEANWTAIWRILTIERGFREKFATSSASSSEHRNWLHQPKGITADHWNYLRLWADCGHGVGTDRLTCGTPVRCWRTATGASLAELMGRLGHGTPQAAMRYQHAAHGRDQAIAELLSKLAGEGP